MAHRQPQSRNWVQYNEQLVRRGEILLKVDLLKDWHQEIARMNEGKRGRPFVYPETLMLLFGMIRAAFHLPSRQLEGFAHGLGKLTQLPAPDYTTFSLRLPQLRLDLESQLDPEEPVILVVDSTGIKRTYRGHWLEEAWGIIPPRSQSRRGWIKIHIAIAVKTKQVLSLRISGGHVHDTRYFQELVTDAQKQAPIQCVLADSAYDSAKHFAFLRRRKIEPGINPRGNSGFAWYWDGKPPRRQSARAAVIRKWLEDPEQWRTEIGYSQRQAVESYFSAFKWIFGETVQNRDWLCILEELRFKVWLYNLWLTLGAEPAGS